MLYIVWPLIRRWKFSILWWLIRIATVDPTDSVIVAAKRMHDQKASCAVITVDNKPRGILTWATCYKKWRLDMNYYKLCGLTLSSKFSELDISSYSSRDIVRRVVAVNLPIETTLVEKVIYTHSLYFSFCSNWWINRLVIWVVTLYV